MSTVNDVTQRDSVSLNKACELVGVSRRTLYNWINDNKVEYIRTAGGAIRIFTDTLFREPTGATLGSSRLSKTA